MPKTVSYLVSHKVYPNPLLRVGANQHFSKVGIKYLLTDGGIVGKSFFGSADRFVADVTRDKSAARAVRFPKLEVCRVGGMPSRLCCEFYPAAP